MVERHEAPHAAVFGVVAVVAHHPVVVLCEGVGIGFLAVDEELAVALFERVVLVGRDDAAEHGDVFGRQPDGGAFFRNPHGAVVVHRPAREVLRIVREEVVGVGVVGREHLDLDVGIERLDLFHLLVGEEVQSGGGIALYRVDAPLFQLAGVDAVGRRDAVEELHLARVLGRLAVDVHLSVADLERIAGQADAALDVVVFLVEGAHHQLHAPVADGLGIGLGDGAPPVVVDGPGALREDVHAVALGVVEHDDLVVVDGFEGRQAREGDVGLGEVRLAIEAGDAVVQQRHHEHRLRRADAVVHLADEQEVAHQQRLLHRRGGDGVGLDEEHPDERRRKHGEDDGLGPLAQRALLVGVVAHELAQRALVALLAGLVEAPHERALGLEGRPQVLLLGLEPQVEEVARRIDDGQGRLPEAVFAERAHHVDGHAGIDEDVDDGHQQQQRILGLAADEARPHHEVEAGHQPFPPFFSCFRKNEIQRNAQQHVRQDEENENGHELLDLVLSGQFKRNVRKKLWAAKIMAGRCRQRTTGRVTT